MNEEKFNQLCATRRGKLGVCTCKMNEIREAMNSGNVEAVSTGLEELNAALRVNIRKAVGPDGIPGRVLKACAFQLAGVFYRYFQSVPLSVCGSLMLQKIHHCAHTKEKQNHMLE